MKGPGEHAHRVFLRKRSVRREKAADTERVFSSPQTRGAFLFSADGEDEGGRGGGGVQQEPSDDDGDDARFDHAIHSHALTLNGSLHPLSPQRSRLHSPHHARGFGADLRSVLRICLFERLCQFQFSAVKHAPVNLCHSLTRQCTHGYFFRYDSAQAL